MNSAERRMKLLLMLQTKTKTITVNYLAEYFDVSRRTIFRDLRLLQDMEVPLTYEENEGYGIMRGYTIPPLMFDAKEIATIMVGLNFAKSQKDNQLVSDAKAVELKIKNVVPAEVRTLMDALGDRVLVDPYGTMYDGETISGDWFTLATAIAQRTDIGFVYNGKPRKIKPLLLVYYSDHWNTIGFDPEVESLRNYRLDKMMDLSNTNEQKIHLREHYEIKDMIYRDSDDEVEVELVIHESIWMEFRKTCPAIILRHNTLGDYLALVLKFDNLVYLNKWLLRFGEMVQIRTPQALKDIRKEMLKNMLQEEAML